jgi:hypothetical protein
MTGRVTDDVSVSRCGLNSRNAMRTNRADEVSKLSNFDNSTVDNIREKRHMIIRVG